MIFGKLEVGNNMNKFFQKDLKDKTFGRLRVIDYAGSSKWNCICNCGNTNIVKIKTQHLNNGNTQSCGCIKREQFSKQNKKHGLSETVEYSTWCNLKKRCYISTTSNYKDYGGRGIKVCDEWINSFQNFYNDMGPRPSDKHSIDRIDNDGPYCKENCKWSTKEEQNNNQRSNKLLTHNGKTQTVTQWSQELNINCSTLRDRLDRGWTIEETLSITKRKR